MQVYKVSIVNRSRLYDRYLTTDNLDEAKAAMVEHIGHPPEEFDWWPKLESFWRYPYATRYNRQPFYWQHGAYNITVKML